MSKDKGHTITSDMLIGWDKNNKEAKDNAVIYLQEAIKNINEAINSGKIISGTDALEERKQCFKNIIKLLKA